MKNNILEYKGYHTKILFDAETCVLRGKIEGINDLVNFESTDVSKIEEEFHDAVDDYLSFCEEVGKTPEKEYKGTFNIRISPELHKKLAIEAYQEDESLNAIVERAIEEHFAQRSKTDMQQETILILSRELETQRIYNRKQNEIELEGESKFISDPVHSDLRFYYQ